MSDVSAYTDIPDSNVQSCEDYLGLQVSLDDLADMSAAERQALFESYYTQNGMSAEKIAEFIEALDTEMSDWEMFVHTQYEELEAILNSGNSIEVADAATIEFIMEELKAIQEMCGGTVINDAEAAEDDYTAHNITLEDDDTYTLNVSDPENGETYNIDATCDDGTNGFTSAMSVDNADGTLADIDHDGVIEETEKWDTDADGQSEYDLNQDGVIDETDNPTYSDGSNGSTVTITVPDGATAYVMSHSADPAETRIKITLEDGTYYYINI